MRLQSIKIKNFRSIRDMEFTFPDSGLLVLVGPNNAGKSNIIRAIDSICGDNWFSKGKMEDHDFYLRDRQNQVQIELSFDNRRKAIFNSSMEWPSYIDERGRAIYKSNGDVRDEFPCTYLGADRTFDKHLSFYDWTLIGKIRKAFHRKAANIKDRLNRKFDELIDIFDEVQGFSDFKDDFAMYFREMQADTEAKLEIDFKPFTPSNYFKTMQILASDSGQGGDVMDLSELGEGSRNTALLALLRSYAKNFRGEGLGLLALEEPEVFLHPQARRHLFGILRQMAEDGMQVVISTHSSSFIDTEFFDSIGQVFKVADSQITGAFHTGIMLAKKSDLVQKCIATGVPREKVSEQGISEFYKTTANPQLNEAFFARLLILVEGDTEELALSEYLKLAGIDCDLNGISIISVRGKNQMPKYWRLFSLFRLPIVIVFDNDNSESGRQKSNQNVATCFGISLKDIVEGVSVYKHCQSKTLPQTDIIVLERDFEYALEKDFCAYFSDGGKEWLQAKIAEAKELIKPIGNQNKGQIARYLARQIVLDPDGYCPSFVTHLAAITRSFLPNLRLTQLNEDQEEEIPF